MSVAALLSAPTSAAQSRPTCPGAAAADNFFPRGELSPQSAELDALEQRLYSQRLRAMGEPSLSCGQSSEEEVYRFLWLPTFQHPLSVRITRTGDGAALDMAELTGASGDEPGTVGRHEERKLTNAEWQSLQAALGAIDFWNMPANQLPPDPTVVHTDGTIWILEGYRAGAYHVVDRWSPEKTPYANACLKFLDLANHTSIK